MTAPHVVEKGSGTALFCLHGISSSAQVFAGQLEGLSGSLRVMAWDAPGYGASADLEGPATIDAFAAAAETVIEGLPGGCHLLGSSWGGVIAATVALRRPDLLRSLILVGASRGSGRAPDAAEAMRSRYVHLEEEGLDAFSKARAPRLLSPGAPAALVGEVAAAMASALRPSGYRAATAAMAGADLTRDLSRISVPTLVVCGAEDTVTGPAESQQLSSAIRGSVLVTVRDAGHLVHLEAPESFNSWVGAFVDIVDGTVVDHARRRVPAWT